MNVSEDNGTWINEFCEIALFVVYWIQQQYIGTEETYNKTQTLSSAYQTILREREIHSGMQKLQPKVSSKCSTVQACIYTSTALIVS